MELEATIVQSADRGAKTSKGKGALLPRQGVSTHLQQQNYKDSLTFFKQFSRYERMPLTTTSQKVSEYAALDIKRGTDDRGHFQVVGT